MARVLLPLSAILGGASLAAFGLALAFGPLEVVSLHLEPRTALVWDAGLCLLFFVQHSGMVRVSFRDRLTRHVPPHYHAALYSIVSGVALLLLVGLWQRPGIPLLTVEGGARWALRGIFALAGVGFLWAVRSLSSFDSFGLEPIRARIRGAEPRRTPLAVRGAYRWVRHPLYSLLLVFLWTSPDLTADRLLFNGLFSVWIVIAARLEERDLVREFGDDYRDYQREVPMLVPWRRP